MSSSDEASGSRTRSRFVPLAVAAIAALHFLLSNASTWDKSGTFDESSHVANGYSCWATGDYRMYPVAILQHRWITLPLYLSDYKRPAPEGQMWTLADNWEYGRQFLFRLGNDSQRILHTARIMTSLWSVLLCVLVFVWSRQLFGTAGGFVSLLLYAFNPNVLAHASSATIDLPAALGFTASLWTLWRVLERLTLARLAASGLVWGLALTSKFSTLLLVPMAVGLLAVRIAYGKPWTIRLGRFDGEMTSRLRMLSYAALITVVHAVACWIVIWAMFGFRFEMYAVEPKPVEQLQFQAVLPQARGFAPIIGAFHKYRLFPEAYLYCFCNTMQTVSGFNSFLNGRFEQFGDPWFFPLSMLYKTPFAVFLIGAAALGAHVVRRVHQIRRLGSRPSSLLAQGFYATAPLWCLLVVYGYSAVTGSINIGIRHILPTFPPLFILFGAAGLWLQRGTATANARPSASATERRKSEPPPPANGDPRQLLAAPAQSGVRAVLVALLIWFLVDVVGSYPHYLAYFNFTAGGPANGYKHLVDSSLDWGQELPALKRWIDGNKVLHGPNPPKLFLSYFGSTPPSHFGIDAVWLPSFFDISTLEGKALPLPNLDEGIYCISATMLQCVYLSPFHGPWTQQNENNYQALLRLLQINQAPNVSEAEKKAALQQSGVPNWETVAYLYDRGRLARLCATLRRRKPLDMINYGILIYRVSAMELQNALFGAAPLE